MAEGCEDTENSNNHNNNADTPAMLGTVLPCEAITAALGSMKREFDSISGGGGGGNSSTSTSCTGQSGNGPTTTTTTSYSSTASSPAASPTTSHHQPTITTASFATSQPSPPAIVASASATTTTTGDTKILTGSCTSGGKLSITKSPTPSSSSSSGNAQQLPINLKSEDEDTDIDRINASTPPILISDDKDQQTLEFYKNLSSTNHHHHQHKNRLSPIPDDDDDEQHLHHHHHNQNHHHDKAKAVAASVAAAHAHLNGTMQDMINLQKLQNLASLQQQQQQHLQHSSVPAAFVGLQGLAGISSAVALNSPLNLSIGSTNTATSSTTSSTTTINKCNSSTSSGILLGNNNASTNLITGCNSPTGSTSSSSTVTQQMPQLILASGQLVQGVQGAQLLIPTAQGIAVQTVLTIPVSQQINTNEQFLQNYSALNSGAAAAAAAAAFNNMNLAGVQQLLAALHPQLFPSPGQQQQQQQQQQVSDKAQSKPPQIHVKQATQQQINNHHRQTDESLSPKLEQSSHHQQHHHHHHHHQQQQQLRHNREHSNSPPIHLRSTPPSNHRSPVGQHSQQQQQQQPSQQQQSVHSKESPSHSVFQLAHDKLLNTSTTSPSNCPSNNYTSPTASQLFRDSPHNGQIASTATATSIGTSSSSGGQSSSHSLSSQLNNPNSVLSNINRLTNGELTITKSHGPSNHASSSSIAAVAAAASSSPTHQQQQSHHPSSLSSMKMSPSSIQQISPHGTDTSTADLLIDSPNELTINQTNCNVVDGIDLDEIKEFAKAFKLRRLSLGLTQTQVGQALSVTEGPAYSQSAICSALAAQMYAAQLSSQQQNMFEKLDITPKSAQKIKPVLERWMKEAEESHWNRYKSGQNHLTDFIGVEPSKKRKRRTSFTPQALELLNAHFERNTHPSGTEITGLAHQLGYEREVIRIWFCNKRQALKNTVRMMSKGMV